MQKTYALFDFDGTLESGDSIVRLLRYAHRKGLCGAAQLLAAAGSAVLYALGLTSPEASKRTALRFLVGRSKAEAEAFAADFARDELIPRLRPEGRKAIAAHLAHGDTVLLVSASPSFYLEPLKAELGFSDILATRFELTDEEGFTGLMGSENCRGVQKPLRLAEYLAAKGDRLDYDTSSAYGDSAGDLAMLRLCARKVAVNPKRKLMKKLAQDDGVVVVHWNEP